MKDKIEIEEIIEVLVIADRGQVQEQPQIGTELDVTECKEYDHFARDCPMTQANREMEQIQQMLNLDEDHMTVQIPLMDADQDNRTVTPVETRDNLNL